MGNPRERWLPGWRCGRWSSVFSKWHLRGTLSVLLGTACYPAARYPESARQVQAAAAQVASPLTLLSVGAEEQGSPRGQGLLQLLNDTRQSLKITFWAHARMFCAPEGETWAFGALVRTGSGAWRGSLVVSLGCCLCVNPGARATTA